MKIINPDLIQLDKGDVAPFVCPNCTAFIEFYDSPAIMGCPKCFYSAPRKNFETVLENTSEDGIPAQGKTKKESHEN